MVRMNGFRNRLLALVIGLVVVMQSVTLVAVRVNPDHEVVLARDSACREAVAGGIGADPACSWIPAVGPSRPTPA